MKAKPAGVFAAIILLAMLAAPAFAHHGAAAYDLVKSTTLQASVTGLEWSNPHVLLHFDAKDDKGAVHHWSIELNGPLVLSRAGWSRDTLKAGDAINITFHAAKNGTGNGYIRPNDGKIIFNGEALNLGVLNN